MSKEIKKMLDEEIVNIIADLNDIDEGSEDYSNVVNNLAKLHKLRIDEIKAELELKEKEKDLELKKKQAGEQKLDRYFKLGVGVAEIVLPLIFYGVWMNKGFEFEKEGTFTSSTFRGLFKHFRPTK
jgi:hypothetical protein